MNHNLIYLYVGDDPVRSIDKKVAMAIFKEVGLPSIDEMTLDDFQLRTLEIRLMEFQGRIADVKRGAERNDQWIEKQSKMNLLSTAVLHIRDAVYTSSVQRKRFSWKTK